MTSRPARAALSAPLALLAALASAGWTAQGDSSPAPGRPVAPIVSSSWGSQSERDRAGEVDQIIARLGLKPGDSVADIGAGEGYDALRLAERLGPHSLIIAEDVQAAPLRTLAEAARSRGLKNIRIIVGAPSDPRLPPRSLDAAIMVHMYHEVARPFALLQRLAAAFRADGRLGVEELDRPTAAHGTPPALLRCEVESVGYRERDLGPLDGGLGYFAVFLPPKSAPLTLTRRPDCPGGGAA